MTRLFIISQDSRLSPLSWAFITHGTQPGQSIQVAIQNLQMFIGCWLCNLPWLWELPMWHLARHAGLTVQQAVAVTVYLLYHWCLMSICLSSIRKLWLSCLSRGGFGCSEESNRVVLFKHYFYLGMQAYLTVAAMGIWLLVFGGVCTVFGINSWEQLVPDTR